MPPGEGGVPMRQPGVPVSSTLGVASMPSSMRVRMALALLPQTRMTCAQNKDVRSLTHLTPDPQTTSRTLKT